MKLPFSSTSLGGRNVSAESRKQPSRPVASGVSGKSPKKRHVQQELRVVLLGGKGGAGKTTTAVNIAVHQNHRGIRAGIFDLDAQGSARAWRQLRSDDSIPVGRYPIDAVCDRIARLREDNRKLLPNKRLSYLYLDVGKDPTPQLAEIVRASDFVVLPSRPSFLDAQATIAWVKWVESLDRRALVVINAAPSMRRIAVVDKKAASSFRTFENPSVREIRKAFIDAGCPIYHGQITQRMSVVYAVGAGMGCKTFEPKGLAAREYNDLAVHIDSRVWNRRRYAS